MAREVEKKKSWAEIRATLRESLYSRYAVSIRFRDKLLGGQPRDAEAFAKAAPYIMPDADHEEVARRAAEVTLRPDDDADIEAEVDAISGDVATAVVEDDKPEIAEPPRQLAGFPREDDGKGPVYFGPWQLKRALSDRVTRLGLTKGGKAAGQVAGLKVAFEESVVVMPEHVEFRRNRKRIEAPDGIQVIRGHVSTPQGRRSIVTPYEYVRKAGIECQVWVQRGVPTQLDAKLLGEILVAAEECGCGSARKLGFGRFDVVGFESID